MLSVQPDSVLGIIYMFKIELACGWNHQLYKAWCILVFSGGMYYSLGWVLVWRYDGFRYR